MKSGRMLIKRSGLGGLSVSVTVDLRFDLKHGFGTILGGDPKEFLAVGFAALYFIKTALEIAGSGDHRGAGENIVYERAGLRAVEQAGTRFSLQADSHAYR